MGARHFIGLPNRGAEGRPVTLRGGVYFGRRGGGGTERNANTVGYRGAIRTVRWVTSPQGFIGVCSTFSRTIGSVQQGFYLHNRNISSS
ncbi:hypothetical protein NDU88_002944 [Pleurodeles waltl]|uniref:Uncharacterized protein n=1 Tax=Pleurodeles waltl TaxID=8319 RepID=A0AAV7SEX5_PLEWA|nr:hypothetical protein NDU88_002944 [Pleurodeles waltl]